MGNKIRTTSAHVHRKSAVGQEFNEFVFDPSAAGRTHCAPAGVSQPEGPSFKIR